MKKLVGILAISALAVSAFAQGTINVANNAGTVVQQWASATDHTLSSVAPSAGKVQFFAAADGTAFKPLGTLGATSFVTAYNTVSSWMTANPGWTAYQIGNIAPVAGRFSAGVATVSPLAAGGKIEYVLAAWNGTSATLDAAIAVGASVGQSPLFTGVSTGNPSTTPPGTPSSLTDTFTAGSLVLAPTGVPEPSTFALAGLGAAAMLILRRRK
jgi:hypothetical protein